MDVTIWHNPACSNSRGALKLIRDAGFDPEVIEYLGNPPDAATLRRAGRIRTGRAGAGAQQGGAVHRTWPEDADEATLLAAMAEHPRLINRPVVRTPKGTRLCRPPETVLEIL